ncbi:hypothetical protein LTR67_005551 [Exophiala xenobiotica]
MADEGLAGTLIGIARAGIKLSVTLHNFSETVTTAQTEIKSIANNVSLTASVLHELGVKLDQDDDDDDDDEGHQLYSSSATGTARDAARECESVFREINVIITKAMQSVAERGVKNGKVPALSPLERMKYPFLQPKMELLGANLERLKSTLVLLLNVLSYARDLKTEKDEKDDGYRKLVIDNLVSANQEATRAYETLVKRLDDQDHDGTIPADSPKSPDRSRPTTSSEKDNGSASLGLSMIKTPDLDDSHRVEASSSPRRAKAASTIQACLDRIENALVKVEQSSSVLHHSSGIAVRIELERETQTMTRLPVNAAQNAQQSSLPNPRITVSILQKQTRRRQDSLQSRTRTDSNSNSTRRNTNTNGLSRSNTWYSTLWNSMPSPYSAVSSIQQTLDNTGLFLATEQITEDAGNVLSYNLDQNTAASGNMGYGYHNTATAYAPLSAADGGDESPESADGPTLADAFRAAMPESLVVGRRRPDPSLRIDDIEMNPVGQAQAQTHHNETLRPLILPEAVESGSGSGNAHGHGYGYGQVPEVRIEPDTATATTAATAITLNDADQDQVEHANQNQNGEAAAAAAKNDNGNDWSAEQDARMMEILNASVQAAVAEGKKGLEISSPNSGTGKQTETGDDLRSDPRMAVDKKGKGKAREYEVPSSSMLKPSGTGTGSAGGDGGGDAIDRLLGEWTTLRVSGSAAGNGQSQGEAGDD